MLVRYSLRTLADSAGSVIWIGETCTHVLFKMVVRNPHDIQITCGSLKEVSRINLNCAIKAQALAHEEAVRRESDVTTDSVCSHPHLDP